MKPRLASPRRLYPMVGYPTEGIGDKLLNQQQVKCSSNEKRCPEGNIDCSTHQEKNGIYSNEKKPREAFVHDGITNCIAAYSANGVGKGERGKGDIADDYNQANPTEVTNNFDIAWVGRGKSITANSLYCPAREGIKVEVGHRKNGDRQALSDITDNNIIDGSQKEARENSTSSNSDNCSTDMGIRKQSNMPRQVGKILDAKENQWGLDLAYNKLYGTAINDTITKLSLMFPEQVTADQINKLREVATEGYKLADSTYTARDAEEWGDHYEVSDDLVRSDEALFKASMRDIKVMTTRRQKKLLVNRLNTMRVELYTRTDNPEREKLMLLANKGMPLLLRDGFTPNGQGKLPPLRKTYTAVKSAVNRLLVENFHSLGLAFILTKSTALTIPGIHFSPLHWTEKKGKRQGRPIGDCSDGGSENGNEPLNSLSTKEQSDQLWGTIHHPSIEDVANMITDYYQRAIKDNPIIKWSDLVMYKKDLKGAFTLLFFDADGVQNLAMELTDNKVIIFICGIFGWTGTPAAFQVVNRAIMHELKYTLRGTALMYSDDIFGVTTLVDAPADMEATDKVCSNLMGPDSMEQTKEESGRCLTFIGYDIDLDMGLITISKRNMLRTLYGFLSVNLLKPVKVKTMQKLASWASRYGKICVYMKPFISVLYAEYAGKGEHTSFMLSEKACQVIRFFRVLLGLTAVNKVEFSRTISSFKCTVSSLIIEFDASLTGIGLLYYQRSENGEVLLGGGSVDISSLHFDSEASYQNTAEFIAAVLGIRGLKQLGLKPRNVCLRGDSITALTWASTSRFRGGLVGNAAAAFILQNIYEKISISEVVHLAAADNWRADFLSRGGTMGELLERDCSLGKSQVIELNGDAIIQLCDPVRPTTTDEEFNSFWLDMRQIIGTNN